MKIKFKEYAPSREAVREARAQGIYGDTAKRLARMARRSAPVTSDFGNRRFHDFVLHAADGMITSVTRLDPAH